MDFRKIIKLIFCAFIFSACTSSNSNESNTISGQTQSPTLTLEGASTFAFSSDKQQLNALIPECINVMNAQPVTTSALERFGYKKSAISIGEEIYQNITSRNAVGLTRNFDQFSYKLGKRCSLRIGMSIRDRFFSFKKHAFLVLEKSGFMRVETKDVFGNSVIQHHSVDGKFLAKVTLENIDPSGGLIAINKL